MKLKGQYIPAVDFHLWTSLPTGQVGNLFEFVIESWIAGKEAYNRF